MACQEVTKAIHYDVLSDVALVHHDIINVTLYTQGSTSRQTTWRSVDMRGKHESSVHILITVPTFSSLQIRTKGLPVVTKCRLKIHLVMNNLVCLQFLG